MMKRYVIFERRKGGEYWRAVACECSPDAAKQCLARTLKIRKQMELSTELVSNWEFLRVIAVSFRDHALTTLALTDNELACWQRF